MNFQDFQSRVENISDVSRETFDRLEIYAAELKKWNPKINLISKNRRDDIWERHFIDSLQILSIVKEKVSDWIDLGSGGGFPGLVLASVLTDVRFRLIESDQRKCAFLRKTAREMGLNVDVVNDRIENYKEKQSDIVSARALAPLDKLIGLAMFHVKQNGKLIFLKGRNWKNELTLAEKNWQMSVRVYDSVTDQNAKILEIQKVSNK